MHRVILKLYCTPPRSRSLCPLKFFKVLPPLVFNLGKFCAESFLLYSLYSEKSDVRNLFLLRIEGTVLKN